MPFVTVNRNRLFYRLEGAEGFPVLALSHSIGTDHGMWEPQMKDLFPHFQILRFDTRGHGASDAPPGDYSVEEMGRDVLGLMDALKLSRIAFCGLSMGSAIGQWLAVNAPERITALILANASPRFGTHETWSSRIQLVQQGGMAAVVDMALQRFFSPQILKERNPHVASIRSVLLGTDAAGYLGCCAAMRDFDANSWLSEIKTPTLIIAGKRDISTPWAGNGEILAQRISGARSVVLQAAHLSNIEAPRSFSEALFGFLSSFEGRPEDSLKAGFAVRRRVLGNAHVDSAIKNTNDFNADFQDLITRYAWGTIWIRPGLDQRMRRLLVLAATAALGRWDEFRLHVSTGLADGLEPCDIKEALLQTAIYAGVPAANTGFRIAMEEMEKAGTD